MNKLLILLMLSVAFVFTANAQTAKFVGTYEFSEDGGKTAGGTAIYVGHDLNIKADGTATLTANGYQTSKDIIAKTKMVGTKLQLIFDKYNAEGFNTFESYKGGELLFTLEWKTVKGKKVLWTTFGKYEPAAIGFKKTGGVYFKKSK
ncbi:MAG: DUF5991 domain-containing protein [Acidobacteriota bacterium]